MKKLSLLFLTIWLVLPGATAYCFPPVMPTSGGAVGTDAIWDAKGDLAVGSAANTATKLTIGTAYQVLHVATDTPGWTSTLGATGTRLTAGWFTDLTVTNAIAGSITGNSATATALAADPADCAAGQVATGIAASGALSCTATPSVTTLTGAVTGTASGNIPNTLADAAGDLIQGSADNTWARLARGAQGTVPQAGAASIAYTTYALPTADCTENQILKANASGDFICAADADSGGATSLDDIGDPDAATTIAMGDNESLTLESAEDTGTVLVIKNTDADLSGATSLLDLTYNDDGSANGYFIRGYDNAYTDLKFSIGADGAISAGAITASSVTVSPSADPTVTFSDSDDAAGTAKIYGNSSGGTNAITMYLGVEIADGTENTNFISLNGASTGTISLLKPVVSTGAMYPASADGAALGSATAEWSDLFLADGAVINLGADQDVTLTHVADTGVLLNSTRQLQFGDSGTYVNQPADGYLGLTGDTGVRLTASDEDLQIVDAGANNIGITSTTGVTDITFYGAAAQNALNLATTGTILGAVKVQTAGSTEGAGAHAYSPDAALMYGILITIDDSDSVTTVNLPDYQATAATDHVKVGASVCVLNLQAKATIIAPAADDKIRTNNGTLNAAAATVTGPATIGAFSCFILTDTATDVGHWTQMGINGAWPVTP